MKCSHLKQHVKTKTFSFQFSASKPASIFEDYETYEERASVIAILWNAQSVASTKVLVSFRPWLDISSAFFEIQTRVISYSPVLVYIQGQHARRFEKAWWLQNRFREGITPWQRLSTSQLLTLSTWYSSEISYPSLLDYSIHKTLSWTEDVSKAIQDSDNLSEKHSSATTVMKWVKMCTAFICTHRFGWTSLTHLVMFFSPISTS